MSDLQIVDPAMLIENAADPGEFVVSCLERGKSWLTEALEHNDLDALVNMKGWAATLRTATMQKNLGKDAELAATELVRRAERAIGLGVRAGQAEGDIAVRGATIARPSNRDRVVKPVSDFVPADEWRGNGAGVKELVDDVTDDQFEQAIAEAKAEQNLSRANLTRKVKGKARSSVSERWAKVSELAATGYSSRQIAETVGLTAEALRLGAVQRGINFPADAIVGKTRHLDTNRIVRAATESVDGIGVLFDQIDYSQLDPEDVKGWLPILDESIRSLTTLRNQLRKVSQP